MKKKIIISSVLVCGIAVVFFFIGNRINPNPVFSVGQPIDSLNHVIVYYNGGIGNVEERNTVDGYNVGLKYQCVEFVKRYYFEYYDHRMPDSWGHAVSFFQIGIKDGKTNTQRNLTQFTNPSSSTPQIGDLVIYDGTSGNPYGHVAIISAVGKNSIEIIQQNPGPFSDSRVNLALLKEENQWRIDNERILGWLRK